MGCQSACFSYENGVFWDNMGQQQNGWWWAEVYCIANFSVGRCIVIMAVLLAGVRWTCQRPDLQKSSAFL